MTSSDKYRAELDQVYKDGFAAGEKNISVSILDRPVYGPKSWAWEAGFRAGQVAFEKFVEKVSTAIKTKE